MASLNDIPAGTWNIDDTHSQLGFVVRHLMVSKVRGKFTDYTAEANVGEQTTNSSITFTVQTASIDTGNADRDAHVKSGDFFDVEAYPTMTFVSSAITDNQISGELTIKGITKPVTFDYDFNGTSKDPWGGLRAGFEATAEISRGDFGITFNAPLETGGVMISDKVKIVLDLEFVKA